ncbi:smoothelin isoform X2 [Electrophorus electricus]|uniref:smoothelin isoform X2 n=1 Tax=Electrophorus electricus TaxID=8005 RepID=UPI0015CFA57C|nr:smoothelin isoform X2 [Electrophorus electricus]
MTDQKYSTLDETSLRNLLDGTVDIVERRLIRTAIRELQRCEIEDMEAALTNKRFRRGLEHRHEDKENQLRPDVAASLDMLSRKVEDIQDIDTLSAMLQNTTEYEERKLIRAAIRRLRAKEIQGALERIQLTGRHVEQPQNPQRRINVEDTQRENVDRTERIDKLQNQTRHKEALATGSNSDMVLVLDPLLRESVSCPLPICAGSPPSDALPTYKDCSDSAESDQSGGSLHCGCLNSSALAPCHGSCVCSTLVSDISERGTSQKWAAGAEPGGGSSPGTNLGAGGNAHGSGKAVDLHSTTTAVTETQDEEVNGTTPASTLNLEPNCPRGRPKGRALKHREVTLGIDTLLFPLNKDAVFTNRPTSCQPLSQAGSVPDSVCKFTEPLETLVQRRNEQHSIQSPDTSSHCSPLLPSSCLAASTARGGGHGNDSPAQSQACADQSLGVVGGSQNAAENVRRSSCSSDEGQAPEGEASSGIADTHRDPLASMKTFLTIEIKDGRTASQQSPLSSSTAGTVMPRILSGPGGQRSELTLGLRATPFKFSNSSFSMGSSIKMEESAFTVASAVQMASDAPAVPNGSSLAQLKSEAASSSSGSKLTSEQLEAIQDEEILDKMLDDSKDFEERKMIRAAMRELRKKKREARLGCSVEELDQREKEREVRLQELRQQREERAQKDRSGAGEVVVRKVEKSVDGSTVSEITKTNRFAQSDEGSRMSRSTITETTCTQKSDRGTMQTKSYSYSSSSSTKKVGSVFDREDDSALERRQAERRKELVRAQTLPKTSAVQARRAMMEKLDKDSGSPAQVNKVHRSTSFGVPNANSIKQMLLDWCRAKTRDYENVDIQNFSSSWSDGMAFCALVHNFFPEAFDYSALSPSNRRQNFEVAFKTAEKLADCPQLLDVDDMVRLREPDWKCVYTYLQEFYRGLVQKGLVKTKHST